MWEDYGEIVGRLWEWDDVMWCGGVAFLAAAGRCKQHLVEELWGDCGEIVERLWRDCGEIVERLWGDCGEIVAILWEWGDVMWCGGVASLAAAGSTLWRACGDIVESMWRDEPVGSLGPVRTELKKKKKKKKKKKREREQ